MVNNSLDIVRLLDADASWRDGDCPWTFFAFPTSLADQLGLPPDDDATRLLIELQGRNIRVGIWSNAPSNNTTYFACPKDDIQLLNTVLVHRPLEVTKVQ